MAFCTKCGNQIPDDSAFCTRCGQPTGIAQNGQANSNPAPTPAPTFTPPTNNTGNNVAGFTPPANSGNTPPSFTPPANSGNTPPSFTPPNANNNKTNAAPTFTPPSGNKAAPTFTPPARTFTPPRHSGPSCYYHNGEPAVARCVKCGKNLCKDCFDSYGFVEGEYAGQALCYDCTKALVADNIATLNSNKTKITVTFVGTLIGLVIGAILGGVAAGAGGVFLGAMIGGCFWTFIKNWFIRIGRAFEGGGFSLVGLLVGIFVGFIIEAVISIYRTIRKIIECIIYLKRTSGFIESDNRSLQQMDDYMEYTLVRNQNRGVDIETLLQQNSQLADNSVAQMARTQSEEEIEANMRHCVASINENGEIIRNFAA